MGIEIVINSLYINEGTLQLIKLTLIIKSEKKSCSLT